MKTQSKAKRRTQKKRDFTASLKSAASSGQQSSLIAAQESGSSQSAERGIGKLPDRVEEFDRRFDAGEDLHDLGIDLSKAMRPGLVLERGELELPAFLWARLEDRARLLSVTRDQLVRAWLLEKLGG